MLTSRIANVIENIRRRISDFKEDPLGLPEVDPFDKECPSLSKCGHRRLINIDKAILAGLQGMYRSKCTKGHVDVNILKIL